MAHLMIFLAVVAVVAMIVVCAKANYKNRLDGLARSCQGRLTWNFWGDNTIRNDEGSITFRCGGNNDPGKTIFRFRTRNGPIFRLEPRSLFHNIEQLMGARLSATGDPELDRSYILKNPDGSAAAALRRNGVRESIRRLEGAARTLFGRGRSVAVEATRFELAVTISRNLSDDRKAFEAALRWSRRLRDKLIPATASPYLKIRAVEAPKVVARPGLRCPMCRDDLGGPCRDCAGCGAAYHRDCWEELGGCATLGCRKMYRRRERARA